MPKSSLEKIELSPFVKKAKNITLFIMFILITLLLLPWEQTTKGEGKLIAYNPSERDYTIHAPISGFIQSYHIQEDRAVKKGDLLFEMVDLDVEYLNKLKDIKDDIKVQYTNTQNSLNLLKQKRENLQENLRTGMQIHDKKIAQVKDSLKTLSNEETQAENSYAISKSNYERIKLLFDEGIESKRSYELAHNENVKAEALLKSTIINIQREKKTLEIRKREKERFNKLQENKIKTMQRTILASKNSLKTLDQQIAQASINLSRNSTSKVYATKDGYPLRILINDKDRYVKQGDALIHFAPDVTQRVVLLKVRALDMPLIKEGLHTRVQFFGWPSLQVSGWPKITYGTFGGIVNKVDPIAHEEDSFYAYITEDPAEPWPTDSVLKVGTRATAWVRLSTVAIWYEIWRLHNALPLKMTSVKEK